MAFPHKSVSIGLGILLPIFLLLGGAVLYNQGLDVYTTNLDNKLAYSSAKHLLGTDALGRDYLSRLVYATCLTLLFALIIQVVAVCIGTVSGIWSGLFPGKLFDALLTEYINLVLTIPSVLFLLVFTAVFGKNLLIVGASLALILCVKSSLIIKKRVMIIREKDYILALYILGVNLKIITQKYIFAELRKDIFYIFFIGVLDAVIIETGLSFLGLGVQPPTPSLGTLLREGMNLISTQLRYFLYPGLILLYLTIVLSILTNRVKSGGGYDY